MWVCVCVCRLLLSVLLLLPSLIFISDFVKQWNTIAVKISRAAITANTNIIVKNIISAAAERGKMNQFWVLLPFLFEINDENCVPNDRSSSSLREIWKENRITWLYLVMSPRQTLEVRFCGKENRINTWAFFLVCFMICRLLKTLAICLLFSIIEPHAVYLNTQKLASVEWRKKEDPFHKSRTFCIG